MNIKILLLTNDLTLAKRMKHFLSKQYHNFEIGIFSELSYLEEYIKQNSYNILLSDKNLELPENLINNKLLYISDEKIEEIDGIKTIFIYDKVSNIGEKILDQLASQNIVVKLNNKEKLNTKTVTFVGLNGNVGNTSISVATAKYLSKSGNVMYLNFSPTQDNVFAGSGESSFSVALKAVKSGLGNVEVKVNNAVQNDGNIYYYGVSEDHYDYVSANANDIKEIIQMLKNSGRFQYIVIDHKIEFSDFSKTIFENSDIIFMVDNKNNYTKINQIIRHWLKDNIPYALVNSKLILNAPRQEYSKNCDLLIERLDMSEKDVINYIELNKIKNIGVYL